MVTCGSGPPTPMDRQTPVKILLSYNFVCRRCKNQTSLLHYRCDVHVQDGTFRVRIVKPTGWTHLVLNYIGPNTGEGIKIFNNGWEAHSDRTKWNASLTSGDGRIVVGRYTTRGDEKYASVEIDELIFFNQYLSIEDVRKLHNAS